MANINRRQISDPIINKILLVHLNVIHRTDMEYIFPYKFTVHILDLIISHTRCKYMILVDRDLKYPTFFLSKTDHSVNALT